MTASPRTVNDPNEIRHMLASPAWFPLRFDGSHLVFARMDRQAYHDSIFLDTRRIVRAAPEDAFVDCAATLSAFTGPTLRAHDICHVFHMAHGGSTLLTRAIDIPGENTVYREPEALKQLGTMASAQFFGTATPPEWSSRFRLIVTLLGRGYGRGPRIVKGALPINALIDRLLAFTPGTRALMLYSTLEDYLVSVLKSDVHREWVTGASSHLHRPIDQVTGTSAVERQALPVARAAACIWMTQAVLFDRALAAFPLTRSLDSEVFYDQPGTVLGATLDFFGQDCDPASVEAIVAGDLFARHSKFPDRAFDNRARVGERDRLRAELATEIDDAVAWTESSRARRLVPRRLRRPVCGDAADLFRRHGSAGRR